MFHNVSVSRTSGPLSLHLFYEGKSVLHTLRNVQGTAYCVVSGYPIVRDGERQNLSGRNKDAVLQFILCAIPMAADPLGIDGFRQHIGTCADGVCSGVAHLNDANRPR